MPRDFVGLQCAPDPSYEETHRDEASALPQAFTRLWHDVWLALHHRILCVGQAACRQLDHAAVGAAAPPGAAAMSEQVELLLRHLTWPLDR
jgi:hypothetical protein